MFDYYMVCILAGGFLCVVFFALWLFSRNRLLRNEQYCCQLEERIKQFEDNESGLKYQQRILNSIIKCANQSLSNDTVFSLSLIELVKEFRLIFDSEYCSIGKVVDGVVEDCALSYDIFEDEKRADMQVQYAKMVKKVDINNDNYKVCNALKSNNEISYYDNSSINPQDNHYYPIYLHHILKTGIIKNTTIVLVRNSEKVLGYLQFINSNVLIKETDISPFKDSLARLIELIIYNHQRQADFVQSKNLNNDTIFFRSLLDKKENADDLLDTIMAYLSKEFKAAIISFRIPLLNGFERQPLFFLRRCYVNPQVKLSKSLTSYYYKERLLKKQDEMGGCDYLKCINGDKVFSEEAKDTSYYSRFELKLKKETIIVPIVRDSNESKCLNPDRNESGLCELESNTQCINRFEKLYGVFKLRFFEEMPIDADESVVAAYESNNIKEKAKRLQFLSKQIAVLLNSLVEKTENESLLVFQNQLKLSSFIKIKAFDQTCVEIIKDTIRAKDCVIYRYDELNKRLRKSASTSDGLYKKFISLSDSSNILCKVLNGKCIRYLVDYNNAELGVDIQESVMFVPLIKKDNTCAGIIMLIGKEADSHPISSVYWEYDKVYVGFIVDIMNRISESDAERLVFLQQLSHELLIPITNIVNDNDEIITTAERNIDVYKKSVLIDDLKSNLDRCILFKYIVSDVENIFSTSNQTIQYNIKKCERPQELLLDVVRMMERDAHASKGIGIVTNISEMPPLYLDKERIMQVFINLLKNSIRYSYDNSNINIFYKFNDNMHEIKFVNEGIGINENESESIFELFHRGQNARKIEPRGSGMGLYIVKSIMRDHGGDCVIRKFNNPTEISLLFPNKPQKP